MCFRGALVVMKIHTTETHTLFSMSTKLQSSVFAAYRGYSLSLKMSQNLRSECVNWFGKAEVVSTGPGSVFF